MPPTMKQLRLPSAICSCVGALCGGSFSYHSPMCLRRTAHARPRVQAAGGGRQQSQGERGDKRSRALLRAGRELCRAQLHCYAAAAAGLPGAACSCVACCCSCGSCRQGPPGHVVRVRAAACLRPSWRPTCLRPSWRPSACDGPRLPAAAVPRASKTLAHAQSAAAAPRAASPAHW